MRSSRATVRFLVALLVLAMAAGSPSAQSCEGAGPDPAITSPGQAILGFPYRRALTPEINRYVGTVDAQSDRVASGTFATSWNGTHLTYALVSSEENLARVDEIAATQQALRDPRRMDEATAKRVAASTPAIVWYTGNVHGDETSGADAAIEILYRLAAGRDCAAEAMLDNLIVGIIPTQNPDGRDMVQRQNAYGFDMNRDWFAATQPETDGKLTLLAKYPPVLFIDAHEQGSSNFFFPPNADPIHHEISPESLHWINDLYAPAMAAAFNERRQSDPFNWDFFNYDIYDLFYMGYGDTVPTTAFTAAGMTFEKGLLDTDQQRMTEQFVAGWTSLTVAAANKTAILNDYYRAHRTAIAEGGRGFLEPNLVIQPENTLRRKVPPLVVKHYFIDTRRAATDAARLVGRLLRMGVEVYRLDEQVSIPDLKRFGRALRPGHIREGAYWIPLDQPQKRWIQAILGEDSYVPFPYFYDVTSWSNPLLMNLGAASSGADLAPVASRVLAAPEGALRDAAGASFLWFHGETGAEVAGALALARDGVAVRRLPRPTRVDFGVLHRGAFIVPRVTDAAKVQEVARRFGFEGHGGTGAVPSGTPVRMPRIALYSPLTELGPGLLTEESFGHMRYQLERAWKLPITVLNGLQVAGGSLERDGFDVFIVPGVTTVELALARNAIRSWVETGGVYVGTARPGGTGGTPFAVASGFTSSGLSEAQGLQVPGSQFRVSLNRLSPVTLGAPRAAYWYDLGEEVLSPTTTGRNAARFPKSAPEFWVSGYEEGGAALAGSAALVEETLGSGRVILFSGEPNFRAFTDGTALLLANAIAHPPGAAKVGVDVGSAAAAHAVAAAMATASAETGPGRPIRIEVASEDAGAALRVVAAFTDRARVMFARGSAWFTIPNPEGLTREDHPFASRLLPALRAAGITVRSAVL